MWFTSPCDSLVHPVDALVEEAGELVSEGHTVTVVQATLRTEQALARAGAGAGAYYHYIALHSLPSNPIMDAIRRDLPYSPLPAWL